MSKLFLSVIFHKILCILYCVTAGTGSTAIYVFIDVCLLAKWLYWHLATMDKCLRLSFFGHPVRM